MDTRKKGTVGEISTVRFFGEISGRKRGDGYAELR